MKRVHSDSSDVNKIPRRSWPSNSPSRPEISSTSSNQCPYPASQQQELSSRDPNKQNGSEQQSVPSTSAQSFPTYGYGAADCYNVDPNQNSMMMQYNMYNMRNCPWPDNRMYGMSLENNMQGNSNMPYASNMDSAHNTSTNPFLSQTQGRQGETLQTETFGEETVRQTSSPVVRYSDEEASALMEKLRNEDSFKSALQTLINWLNSGECTKSNCGYFYSLIQSSHNHVWRLMNEKAKFKEDLNEIKMELARKVTGISSQFGEIWKVFEMSSLQKVWDQFTKPQRRNISSWKQDTELIMKTLSDELAAEELDDQDDDSVDKSPDSSADSEQARVNDEYLRIREEIDTLRNRLRAVQEENVAIRNEEETKSTIYKNALNSLSEQSKNMEAELEVLRRFKSTGNTEGEENNFDKVAYQSVSDPNTLDGKENNPNCLKMTSDEVHLITLVGTFLNVHPFGASIDYICSFLKEINPKMDRCRYVESILRRLPNVFKEKSTGVGATLVKEWFFSGFQKSSN